MLFHSFQFLCVFLPLVLVAYHVAARYGGKGFALGCLLVASLAFYSAHGAEYIALLLGSIAVNFGVGEKLRTSTSCAAKRLWFAAGVTVNLAALIYYKYAAFVVQSLAAIAHVDWTFGRIALPLAISFFTFQQIAYLGDVARRQADPSADPSLWVRLREYAFFVTFFPHLIAGPLVVHAEFVPQLRRRLSLRGLRWVNVAVGGSIFVIGLFKKAVLADGFAAYTQPAFAAADAGATLSPIAAWCAVLAFTLQIYFDFSGYSDMAVGLARLFGLRLPENFRSPYLAGSLIDFWHRWHMTLSRFLRVHLYIPLGGRDPRHRRHYANLVIVMVLGGLWHGAGWNFVVWGAFHGLLLCVNHALRTEPRVGQIFDTYPMAARTGGWLLTLSCVMAGWVFFRTTSLESSARMFASMAGVGEWSVPVDGRTFHGAAELAMIAFGFAIVLLAPNTQTLMGKYRPMVGAVASARGWWASRSAHVRWRPSPSWALAFSLLALLSFVLLPDATPFLYFQF